MRKRIQAFRWWAAFAAAVSACGAAGSPEVAATPEAIDVVLADRNRVEVPAGALSFVRTAAVSSSAASAAIEAPARVAFRDGAVARVGAPVAGIVQAVHVRPGQHVERGAPLLTLGSADAAGARAALEAARAVLVARRLELERQRALGERGIGLVRDRVEADAAVAQAQTELARAEHTTSLLGRNRGGVVVVRAPIAGVVLTRSVTRGSMVGPTGEPLLEVGDPDALCVIAEVLDHELERVREGARVTVEIPGRTNPLHASVSMVGSAVDRDTRRAPVWLSLDDAPSGLRAGTYVRAEIEAGDPAIALVPTSAVVLEDGQRAVVYVATDEAGVFERRDVALGRPVRGRVPVLEGLLGDETVVIEGALLLDGSADRVI